MTLKIELLNWIQDRTEHHVKNIHYDIYCVFPEIFPNELHRIISELTDEDLIVLDGFQYLAVTR